MFDKEIHFYFKEIPCPHTIDRNTLLNSNAINANLSFSLCSTIFKTRRYVTFREVCDSCRNDLIPRAPTTRKSRPPSPGTIVCSLRHSSGRRCNQRETLEV